MRATFESFVKAVGAQAGVENLAPDGDNCQLVFDDLPVTLNYNESDDDIMFYCVAGTVPEKEGERLTLFTSLLEANFFFRHTAGSTLSVDTGSGLVAMQRVLPARGLEETELLDTLESYLNMAMLWRERCGGTADESAQASGETSGDAQADTPSESNHESQGWMKA